MSLRCSGRESVTRRMPLTTPLASNSAEVMIGKPASVVPYQRVISRSRSRARDVFELVVVFEIDFMQPIRLCPAAREIAPAGQRLPRRPAVRAAGKGAEFIGRWLRGHWLAELEVPDIGPTQALRVACRRTCGQRQCQQCRR